MVDTPNPEQVERIIEQMRVEGRTFWDFWADYHQGEQITYSYDAAAGEFVRETADVIVGAYFHGHPMSRETLAETLARFSLHEFREQGFQV